MTEDFGRGR